MSRLIPLMGGGAAIVDDEDYARLAPLTWWLCRGRGNGTHYARTFEGAGPKIVFMHHMVLGKPPAGLETDHVNDNGLDNRRSNLRFTTRRENALKRPRLNGGAPGVSYDPSHGNGARPWRARTRNGGKERLIGRFSSEAEAARAYNEAVGR